MSAAPFDIRAPLRVVIKSWGREVDIVNNDQYCGKIIYIYKGQSGSLHYHRNKRETFYLRSGKITIEINGSPPRLMCPGQVLDVPAGTRHRFAAVENSEILEFSTPHDDEDTYRL